MTRVSNIPKEIDLADWPFRDQAPELRGPWKRGLRLPSYVANCHIQGPDRNRSSPAPEATSADTMCLLLIFQYLWRLRDDMIQLGPDHGPLPLSHHVPKGVRNSKSNSGLRSSEVLSLFMCGVTSERHMPTITTTKYARIFDSTGIH